MNNPENIKELIAHLRSGAEEKEDHDCEMALRHLGNFLGGRFMLEFTAEELRRFLPQVEKYDPKMDLVYKWLDIAQQINPANYESWETKVDEKKTSSAYPETALGAVSYYLQTALEGLDRAFQAYFELNKPGYAGLASIFKWLFRCQVAMYQHLNCPEAFAGYMWILNRERVEDFSKLSKEVLEEFSIIQKASRDCAKETPYKFWLEVADDLEKRLQGQLS